MYDNEVHFSLRKTHSNFLSPKNTSIFVFFHVSFPFFSKVEIDTFDYFFLPCFHKGTLRS